MAAFKNQHFVPKVHLRNFSDNGSSINIFNILRSLHIEQASIKGQCSKNFFYGTDLILEKAYHLPEHLLGRCNEFVRTHGYISRKLSDDLKFYTFVQFLRTESYVTHMRKMQNLLTTALTDDPRHNGEFNIPAESDEFILKSGYLMALEFSQFIDLFNFCLIKAGKFGEFFTSDNPAFRSNVFAQLKRQDQSTGMFNAGSVFQFPISSEYVFLMYDRHCYTIPDANEKKVYECKKFDEVLALNEATFIHAFKNVYYRDDIREQLSHILPGSEELREQFGTERHFAVFESSENGYTKYKVVDQEESFKHQKLIIHLSQRYPEIRRRFSPLKVRSTFKPYDTKSGAGVFSSKAIYERVSKMREERRRTI